MSKITVIKSVCLEESFYFEQVKLLHKTDPVDLLGAISCYVDRADRFGRGRVGWCGGGL